MFLKSEVIWKINNPPNNKAHNMLPLCSIAQQASRIDLQKKCNLLSPWALVNFTLFLVLPL